MTNTESEAKTVDLASLRIQIDPTSAQRALKEINGDLDKTGKKSVQTVNEVKGFGAGIAGAFNKIKNIIFSVQGAITGLIGAMTFRRGIEELVSFQDRLNDMGRVTDRSFNDLRDDIMGLDSALGTPTELMSAYYEAISAGVTDTTKALELVTTSSKAAKAAHISQGETILALTKLMTGYAGEIKNATEASDLLFAIENYGQTTFAELAPVIGSLAAQSHNLAVNSREMGAALAEITLTAGNTSEAATEYQAILTALMKPTDLMAKIMKEYGYSAIEDMIAVDGFIGTLRKLVGATDGSSTALGELFGRQEALSGIMALMINDYQGVTDKLSKMRDIAGSTDSAFERFLKTMRGRWGTIKSEISKVTDTFLELGQTSFENVLSSIDNVVEKLGQWVNKNKELIGLGFDKVIGGIATSIDIATTSVGYLSTAVDVLTVAVKALIVYEIASVIGGVTLSVTALTGAATVLYGFLAGVFTKAWIFLARNPFALAVTGAYLLHEGLVKLGEKWDGLARYMIAFDSTAARGLEMILYGWKSIGIVAVDSLLMAQNAFDSMMKGVTSRWNTFVDKLASTKLGSMFAGEENKILDWEDMEIVPVNMYEDLRAAMIEHNKAMSDITEDENKQLLELNKKYQDDNTLLTTQGMQSQRVALALALTQLTALRTGYHDETIGAEKEHQQEMVDVVKKWTDEQKKYAETLTFQYDPQAAFNAKKLSLDSVRGLISEEVYTRALESAKRDLTEALVENNEVMAEGVRWNEAFMTAEEKTADDLRTLETLWAANAISADTYSRALEQLNEQMEAAQLKTALEAGNWRAGIVTAAKEYIDEFGNVAKGVQAAFDSTLRGIEDTLVEFFTKGKTDLAAFISQIHAEITRLAVIRPLMAQGMEWLGLGAMGTLPFAMGGIVPHGLIPIQGYAGGGIVRAPQIAALAERGQAEAVVPLPNGRAIEAKVTNLPASSMAITINVQGVQDARSFRENEKQIVRSIERQMRRVHAGA